MDREPDCGDAESSSPEGPEGPAELQQAPGGVPGAKGEPQVRSAAVLWAEEEDQDPNCGREQGAVLWDGLGPASAFAAPAGVSVSELRRGDIGGSRSELIAGEGDRWVHVQDPGGPTWGSGPLQWSSTVNQLFYIITEWSFKNILSSFI